MSESRHSDDVANSRISIGFSRDRTMTECDNSLSESDQKASSNADNPDDVVISGISGTFPKSENVEEFKRNLLAGNDMISAVTRFTTKESIAGIIDDVNRFDYSFFRMSSSQAQNMTISSKMILEKSFEAILDAGYNPAEIKGKNIAVITAIWDLNDEGDPAMEKNPDAYNEVFGGMEFMLSNRISNVLDIHGPSYCVNTACSSSLYAIDAAIKAIQRGQCEGAIVCASNFCLKLGDNPVLTPYLSTSGKSSPFDSNADGYVRAETVAAVFLQKRNHARRVYANAIHSATNCDGFKEGGMASPSVKQQIKLYEQCYKEMNLDPRKISYIEAHGTGTQAGDIAEGTSINEFFCTERESPLKIGTVKSNMGHSEAAAAVCGLIKMIIAFESGIIPVNLRYNTPNPKIKGLIDGHLEIASKPIPLEGEYFAINAFGIGGSNGHMVISPNKKIKNKKHELNEKIPFLVTASGRTEEAVNCILNNAEKNSNDPEYIRLLHEVFKYQIGGHQYRGYTIIQKNKPQKNSTKFFAGENRPIWFIFAGLGSQWTGMGKSLMEIPILAESIRKSHQFLKPKGLDLIKIITDDDPKTFDNILNSFVGIAAIQIALVDLLTKLNVQPDGIVGHSLGELGCAYADGCFTSEQMLLVAYYRGLVSIETPFIHGTMVAVGQSYDVMKDIVPPEIEIACHNSPTNCTLSGPTEIMREFIKDLNEKNIFNRAVKTSNIAYHSRYIASAESKFLSYTKEVIPEPKLRSKKWICTSVPEHKWDNEEVKYSSAQYHTNNLLNPVYFEESHRYIPANSITIEIAPHGLLNAILKHSLPNTVDNIPLLMRNNENNVEYLLNALGRIYEAGCEIELSPLYPPIEFPVSRSTPMISPSIKWNHDQEEYVDEMNTGFSHTSERTFVFHPKSKEHEYIQDHIIDGRNIYPGFGYLWLVVEAIASLRKKRISELSIVFENVRYETAMIIPQKGGLNFRILIHDLRNHFEVKCNAAVVVTGKVRVVEDVRQEVFDVIPFKDEISNSDILPLSNDDFYKELRLRGYDYKGLFRGVQYANCTGTYGEVSWNDNFVTYMDTVAQLTLLQTDCRNPMVPTSVGKLVIDFKKHYEILESLDEKNCRIPVNFYPYYGLMCTGGVQMSGWKSIEINRQKIRTNPVLEKYQFVPHISDEKMNLKSAIRVCVQMALKNTQSIKATTYQILDEDCNPEVTSISAAIVDVLNDLQSVEANVNILSNSEKLKGIEELKEITISNEELPMNKTAILIILENIQNKTEQLKSILDTLRDDGFIITKESIDESIPFKNLGFCISFSRIINDFEKIILLKKTVKYEQIKQAIQLKNTSYYWVSEIQNALSALDLEKNEKLVVYAEKERTNGILGFFNCLMKEEKEANASCFFIMDNNAPCFSLDEPFYKDQLDKNLRHNVYKDGKWGSYYHLTLDLDSHVESIHAFCMLEEHGNLSSFKWVEGPLNPSTYKNENGKSLVHVYYSGLNFKDVFLSVERIPTKDSALLSRLNQDHPGREFSGKDAIGNRLMGVVCGRGISTLVETIPHLTWRVPDSMTLEEAASIPLVYATVVFAFFFKMNLKKGQSILIHSGSGGIGQAAINICLHYRCNIFTTVGTSEKKEFIRKTFPQIPDRQIGNSRDTSFVKMIMDETKGKGVDVVLNSLAEDKLRASLRCVAEGGHFLEIGRSDMVKNNSLELGHFLNDIVFYSVQLETVTRSYNNETSTGNINQKLQQMLDEGIIKPINRTIFKTDDVESAFRYMASGKHIGKLVIKIRDEEKDIYAKPTTLCLRANPRITCQGNKSYIVLGGLGGFGMELADWLVVQGARNIVISSRTGIKNGYQSYRIHLWREYGAKVVISTANISEQWGVKSLLEMANSLGPVAGIFNLAAILEDNPFSKQTEEKFAGVADPKAIATSHLDQLSRKMCPHLEHFVVFSSIVSGHGNANQSNYGFANSVVERICETRQADNLPALAIQWGAIGEVGMVSEILDHDLSVDFGGLMQQNVKSCLEILRLFMKQQNPVVCSKIVADKCSIDADIIITVANILGIKDLKTISLTWTLPELGMDSITRMELKLILESEFKIFFTSEDLLTMTFSKLYQLKENIDRKSDSSRTALKPSVQIRPQNIEQLWNEPVLQIPFSIENIEQQQPIDGNAMVFIFPGIDGLALAMESIAEKLPLQVLCCQYHFVKTEHLISETRDYFSSYILEKLGPEQEFNLIAYSFGAVISLEVAAELEKRGRTGRIWLIDTSPAFIKTANIKTFGENVNSADEILQNTICMRTIQAVLPSLSENSYMQQIETTHSQELKKNKSSEILASVIKSENLQNLLHKIIDNMYITYKELIEYELPHFTLDSKCTLIKCVENTFEIPIDEQYGLSKNFKNPIQVYRIRDVDHFTIIMHPNIAEIIMESGNWKKN
ncbi:fatty acid synthase-like isoform X2 [Planococcus citri]|uniref:fatty acid synthase-like isoform X2 n=1 Tax=Planococcus citri TaxID=170843 RepID=UPI0031F7BB87